MADPKLSVCVPSYNHGQYIEMAIRSALNQDFPSLEIVVVDDHSDDDSVERIAGFEDPRLRYFVNESNIGMTRNWNRCISLSKGEYVCILCADDFLLPSFARKAATALDSRPEIGFVFSSFCLVDDLGTTIGVRRYSNCDVVLAGRDMFGELTRRNSLMFSSVVMRRKFIDASGPFDERYVYAPDWEMWARLATMHDVALIAEPLACSRVHAANHTKRLVESGELFSDIERVVDAIYSLPLPGGEGIRTVQRRQKTKASVMLNHVFEVLTLRAPSEVRACVARAIAVYPPCIFDPRVPLVILLSFLGRDLSYAVAFRLREVFSKMGAFSGI